jgi:hypothetical protein
MMVDAATLALEAQRVIALRAYKLAVGGTAANTEAARMVSEKVFACMEAANTLSFGGSPKRVMRRYRTHVRANSRRLNRSPRKRSRGDHS